MLAAACADDAGGSGPDTTDGAIDVDGDTAQPDRAADAPDDAVDGAGDDGVDDRGADPNDDPSTDRGQDADAVLSDAGADDLGDDGGAQDASGDRDAASDLDADSDPGDVPSDVPDSTSDAPDADADTDVGDPERPVLVALASSQARDTFSDDLYFVWYRAIGLTDEIETLELQGFNSDGDGFSVQVHDIDSLSLDPDVLEFRDLGEGRIVGTLLYVLGNGTEIATLRAVAVDGMDRRSETLTVDVGPVGGAGTPCRHQSRYSNVFPCAAGLGCDSSSGGLLSGVCVASDGPTLSAVVPRYFDGSVECSGQEGFRWDFTGNGPLPLTAFTESNVDEGLLDLLPPAESGGDFSETGVYCTEIGVAAQLGDWSTTTGELTVVDRSGNASDGVAVDYPTPTRQTAAGSSCGAAGEYCAAGLFCDTGAGTTCQPIAGDTCASARPISVGQTLTGEDNFRLANDYNGGACADGLTRGPDAVYGPIGLGTDEGIGVTIRTERVWDPAIFLLGPACGGACLAGADATLHDLGVQESFVYFNEGEAIDVYIVVSSWYEANNNLGLQTGTYTLSVEEYAP